MANHENVKGGSQLMNSLSFDTVSGLFYRESDEPYTKSLHSVIRSLVDEVHESVIMLRSIVKLILFSYTL